jgi:PPM family protein phosphatase
LAEQQAVGQTDVGRRRSRNEDSFGLFSPTDETIPALYIVADGMGGHAAGEIASALAVDLVASGFQDNQEGSLGQRLESAIQFGNMAIYQAGRDPRHQGMGSTVVCAAILGRHLVAAHVGDSRLYRIRDKTIDQLTTDHSFVEDQVQAGLLSREEARTSSNRHIITRALGMHQHTTVDLAEYTIEPGDWYLLCTDGLTGQVSDAEIRDTVLSAEPQDACDRLVNLANERGGPDNITVLVVGIAGDTDHVTSGASSSRIGLVPSNVRDEVDALVRQAQTVTPTPIPMTNAPVPSAPLPAAEVRTESTAPRTVTMARPRSSSTAWIIAWVVIGLIAIAIVLVFQGSIRSALGR